MNWLKIIGCTTCVAIAVVIAVWSSGWRRGMPLLLEGALRYLMCTVPLGAVDSLLGRTAFWCVVPLVALAAWFGSSPLGYLNFLVLQWFGIRLQAGFDRDVWVKGPRGRWWSGDAPTRGPISWSILRWVWPLTGWWGRYWWIRKTTPPPTQ